MVAVRERSTTFSWGPMSMVGNPEGSWSSTERSSAPVKQREHVIKRLQMTRHIKACDVTVYVDAGILNALAPSNPPRLHPSPPHRASLMGNPRAAPRQGDVNSGTSPSNQSRQNPPINIRETNRGGLSAAHSPPAGADLPEENATKLRPRREGGGGEMGAKLTQI
ncbi:hypothetical protein EYF80_006040 [Liparis tanakae]|uniref:Uncharacterized protein n=1 Tax=Liparis tanakae TaxID=230148 RepID=A0A4Z2J214_9TELE|nr:hypothetical protein EYF80_006040 [Liparis tanakae]